MAVPLGTSLIGATSNLFTPSPQTVYAQQPGLIAEEEYGVFGAPAQQSLAQQTGYVFQNQSPAFLRSLQSNPIDVLNSFGTLEQKVQGTYQTPIQQIGGVGTGLIADFFAKLGALTSGIPSWAWGAAVLLLVYLFFMRHK